MWVRAFGTERGDDVATLLRLPDTELVHDVTIVAFGVLVLGLLPWVVRGFAMVQSRITAFLIDAPVRPLRAMVAEREHKARLEATQSAEANAMRRFERDIHDGPQQRLVRPQLDLARAERADDPEKVRALLGEIRTQASQTLDELRQTTRGIAPQVLTEHGLAAACDEIAGRSPLPMRVHIDMPRLAAPSRRLCTTSSPSR